MNAPLQVELRDCTNLTKGKPPAQQPYYGADSARYLTPEYLRGSATCESAKPSSNAVYIKDGETILLWDGSNAGEVFLGREGILASTMTLVSPDSRFTPDYFFFALKRWESFLKGQTSGSGIPHVDKEVLEKLEITEFAEPEQSKIAEVLSTVDRAIAQTEALIAKQQRIKTGLMQDLLTRGIDEHGQLRCETTHAFKDSPLGRIPVEWDATTIGARCQVKRGASPRPIQDPKWWGATAGWVRISDVTSARKYLRTTTQRLSVAGVANSVLLQSGEVILSICATIGRPIITTYPVCIHDGFVWFDGLSDEVDREWFYYYLQSREDQLAASRQVGTQGNLNTNIVSGTEFLVPTSKIEQTKIAQILATADRILDDHIASREKLLALKTALMQDLLTGKVRVTPLLQQAEEAVSA